MKNRLTNLLIGVALGAVVGFVIHYLWGPSEAVDPSDEVEGNGPYRSRLDAALAAGRQAAMAREAELKANFEQAKRLS